MTSLLSITWPSTLVALVLIVGLIGVVLMNQRTRRRFHERQRAAGRDDLEPPL